MSNQFEYDFGDEGDGEQFGSDVVGQLRKALRAQEKANKELNGKVEELTKTNSELSGKVRGVSLAELLKQAGAKPAMAKFMTDVEPTKENVTAWLAENGELFGYDPKANADDSGGQQADGQGQPQGVPQGLPPEMEAALRSMQQVQQHEANAAPGLIADDKVTDFVSRVGQNAQSFEDVEKAFRDAGII